MFDPIQESRDLMKADAEIRRAAKAVLTQDCIVRELIVHDHDATHAQALLATMHQTLGVLEEHRSQVVRNLVDANGISSHEAGRENPGGTMQPRRTNLDRAGRLLDEYLQIQKKNLAAQRELMDTRALTGQFFPSAFERLVALGRSERDALLAYLEEVERVTAACSWENSSPGKQALPGR